MKKSPFRHDFGYSTTITQVLYTYRFAPQVTRSFIDGKVSLFNGWYLYITCFFHAVLVKFCPFVLHIFFNINHRKLLGPCQRVLYKYFQKAILRAMFGLVHHCLQVHCSFPLKCSERRKRQPLRIYFLSDIYQMRLMRFNFLATHDLDVSMRCCSSY